MLTFDRVEGGVDADHVVELVRETMEKRDGGGVIVFCAIKDIARPPPPCWRGGFRRHRHGQRGDRCRAEAAVATAATDARRTGGAAARGEIVVLLLDGERERDANDAAADEKSLASCVSKGVAWHNAGLHPEEKAGVEQAFRSGLNCASWQDCPLFRFTPRRLKATLART